MQSLQQAVESNSEGDNQTKLIDASCRQQTSPDILMSVKQQAEGNNRAYQPYAVIQTSPKPSDSLFEAVPSSTTNERVSSTTITEVETTVAVKTIHSTIDPQTIPTDAPAIVNAFHAYAELMLKKQQSPSAPSTEIAPPSSSPAQSQTASVLNPLQESQASLTSSNTTTGATSNSPNILTMSGQVPVRRTTSPVPTRLNLSTDALQAPSPASKSPNTSPLPSPTRVYAMAYNPSDMTLTDSELETITEEKPFK